MSSDNTLKFQKALTIIASLFFVYLLPGSLVIGKPVIQNVETTGAVLHAEDNPLVQLSSAVPQSFSDSDLILSAKTTNSLRNDDNQETKSELKFISVSTIASAVGGFTKLKRFKRSPYPPGFVAWKWKEPYCFCPPGQYFSCRCYYSTTSSEENRKRRSRSKKLSKQKLDKD